LLKESCVTGLGDWWLESRGQLFFEQTNNRAAIKEGQLLRGSSLNAGRQGGIMQKILSKRRQLMIAKKGRRNLKHQFPNRPF
jgi:hypothetical protein